MIVAALLAALGGASSAAVDRQAQENVSLVVEHIVSAKVGVFSRPTFFKHTKYLADRVEIGFKEATGRPQGYCVEPRCAVEFYSEMMTNMPSLRAKCDRVVVNEVVNPTIIHCKLVGSHQDGRPGTVEILYRVNDKKINRILVNKVTWGEVTAQPAPGSGVPNG